MLKKTNTSLKINKLYLHLFIFFLLFFISKTQANTYYFSNSTGNDSYTSVQAQNQATPWKSINKLNSFFGSLVAGDNIYFKRGDTFYGTIAVIKSGTSGNPITIGAYGTGNKPVITGFTTITGWTNEGGGIYSKVISSAALTNMVTIDGVQVDMGRYPDAQYLIYETFSTNTSITDNTLSSTPNWTGAEAVIRKNDWTIERCKITSHSGNTINYTNASSTKSATANYGYFIQNDLRTLTVYGEWYHNSSTGKFYMYFGSVVPTSKTINVATVNNLVSNSNYDFITIDNIVFTGSIDNAINYSGGNDYCFLQKCDISFAGNNGVNIVGGTGITVNSNTLKFCNNNGIASYGTSTNIINNTLTKIGCLVGQATGSGGYNGIYSPGNGVVIRNNIIKSTGYNGIIVRYSGTAIIQYNFVDTACTILDDGAGIYVSTPNLSSRVIDHNIVLNTVGNSDGTPDAFKPNNSLSGGIFLDESTTNVTVSGNTVANILSSGIKLLKASNNTLVDNTIYNSQKALEYLDGATNLIANNKIRRNIFFAKLVSQLPVVFYTSTNNIATFGTADSNYYARPMDDNNTFYLRQPSTSYVYKTLAGWQTFTGQDTHSKKSPKTITNVNELNFQYNASNTSKIVAFSGLSYKDVAGNVYNNSATIAAWSSLVLISNGVTSTTNKTPVANAGGDKSITLPTNTTSLAGTGTDTDGTISSYSWLQLSGPSAGTLLTPAAASTVLHNLIQGTYTYELTVTDNLGGKGSDKVSVTVYPSVAALPGTLLPAVNPTNIINGIDYKYYEGNWTVLPSFTTLTAVKAGVTSTFNLAPALKTSQYGFSFSGFIKVPTDGQYTFYTSSDDGSSLYIDNILTVSNDGVHSTIEKSGTIGLKAGLHAITGLFFQQAGGSIFTVSYSATGISKQVIPATALFRINLLPPVYPTGLVSGLKYKYYEGNWTVLPSFSTLTPIKTGTVSNFDLTPANKTLQYGFNFSGFINIPADGVYTFYTSSDDGSNLYIDNILTVSNDGVHYATEKSGTIGLKAGKHYITGLFFQQAGGAVFTVSYQGTGITKRLIPASSLSYTNNTVARIATDTGNVLGTSLSLRNSNTSIAPNTTLRIAAYPNPATTEFALSVEGGTTEKIEILVTNIQGQTVYQAGGTSNKKYRFGNSFMRGIYIVKVVQGNSVQMIKVIKG